MRLLSVLAVSALFAATLGACLEAQRQGGVSDTSDSDTFAADTGGAFDTSTLICDGRECDDGDPCTYDWCDEATGECRYDALARPGAAMEPPECEVDDHCDDGDACTRDTCVFTVDECGWGGWAYCEHAPIDGCGEPLGVCSGQGVSTTSEVLYEAQGQGSYKVAGRVGMSWYTVCTDLGICDCEGLPDIGADTGAALALSDGIGDGGAWGCRSVGCDETDVSCEPMLAGGHYWVWGKAIPEYALNAYSGTPSDEGAQAPVPQLLSGLEVTGFCLQTNALGLPGRYRGRVSYDGFSELDFDVEAEVRAVNGQLRLVWACEDCGDVTAAQEVELTAGDGTVSFVVAVPDLYGMVDVAVELASDRNSLSGSFMVVWMAGDGSGAEDEPWPANGELTLTRVGN